MQSYIDNGAVIHWRAVVDHRLALSPSFVDKSTYREGQSIWCVHGSLFGLKQNKRGGSRSENG